MGSFVAMSMLGGLLTVLIVGGVLLFVMVKVVRANAGAGSAPVQSMADPVPGTLMVTASAMPSRTALYHMTRITGVISAEGVEPTAVQYSGLIRTSNWPSPGSSLPVIVDCADPTKFTILWDKVAQGGNSSLAQAEALAAAMRERQDRG